jgi:hypothetical protein
LHAADGGHRRGGAAAQGRAVIRKQQIKEALALLDPRPPEREDCRRDIERKLDHMKAVSRAVEYAVTKKSMRAYSAALRKMQKASRNHTRAGGSLALRAGTPVVTEFTVTDREGNKGRLRVRGGGIDQAVALDEKWSRYWQPPSRWLKHKEAVRAAYELLARWNPRGIVVSSTGTWHKLSAILFGDERVNLYRHLRAFAAEWRIRRRKK